MEKIKLKYISIVIVALKLLLISIVVIKYLPEASAEDLKFDQTFFGFYWPVFWLRSWMAL